MNRHDVLARTASFLVLAALALAVIPAPVALAGGGSTSCRVRNVTQDTTGTSLKVMVAAADEGDWLRVRGRCKGAIIGKDLTIIGVNTDAILHGGDRYRVLRVRTGATVTIRHLRIAHGRADVGGAIWNQGTLTLVGSIVSHSVSSHEYRGGGIHNDGTLTLRATIVRHNTSEQGGVGGGISNDGAVVLVDSRVTANRADTHGGGIYNAGTATLTDSVVSANTSRDGGGGGIYNGHGQVTISGSLVKGNTARRDGGGIWNKRGTTTLADSIVRANVASGQGGGIFNGGLGGRPGTIVLEGVSAVSGNTPDDCVGTPAC